MIIHDLSLNTLNKGIKPGTLLVPGENKTMYIALSVVTKEELIHITWLSEELEIFQTTYAH
jgi:hypothetical protein